MTYFSGVGLRDQPNVWGGQKVTATESPARSFLWAAKRKQKPTWKRCLYPQAVPPATPQARQPQRGLRPPVVAQESRGSLVNLMDPGSSEAWGNCLGKFRKQKLNKKEDDWTSGFAVCIDHIIWNLSFQSFWGEHPMKIKRNGTFYLIEFAINI